MIAWLLTPVGKAFAGAAAVLLVIFLIWNSGRSYESDKRDAKDASATTEAYRDRERSDQKALSMDIRDLCLGMGGKWVNNQCE